MVETVYVHVGTPKSGTTYLQAVLAANKERLARHDGVLYPGESWEDQVLAARDVLGANPLGASADRAAGSWLRLVDEIKAWDARAAVISMEWLGSADPDQARQIVSSLAPADVEIVVTVRDLARTVPAAWQEFCQNGDTWTWEEFLRSITAEDPFATPAGKHFWTQQDLGRLLAIWTDLVPSDKVSVITLPPPGSPPLTLWSRFCTAIGVREPAGYDITGGGGNESLGLESAELMRRLNEASRQARLGGGIYDLTIKRALAKQILAQRKPQEGRLGLPAEFEGVVAARQQAQVAQLKASGARLVGELDDLLLPARAGGRQPADVTLEELFMVSLDAIIGLARLRQSELSGIDEQINELTEAAESA
ncbi:MAG: hypothetical protein ACRDQ1_12215, partial [Sciscionella sp.]